MWIGILVLSVIIILIAYGVSCSVWGYPLVHYKLFKGAPRPIENKAQPECKDLVHTYGYEGREYSKIKALNRVRGVFQCSTTGEERKLADLNWECKTQSWYYHDYNAREKEDLLENVKKFENEHWEVSSK